MNRTKMRHAAPAVAALTLLVGLSACGAANEDPASDSGDGSLRHPERRRRQLPGSRRRGLEEGFQTANPDVTVNYDPVGSGGGREQFLAGGLALRRLRRLPRRRGAGEGEGTLRRRRRRGSVYVSPIAVIYNLDGVDELNLSAEDDRRHLRGQDHATGTTPAIKADNPDAELPDSDITPVHRSDDSGTTKNFTDYLDQASDGAWRGRGRDVAGQGRRGSRRHLRRRRCRHERQGHDRLRRRQPGRRPRHSAKIKVGDGVHRAARPEAAAKVLDASTPVEGRAAHRHRDRRRPQDRRGGRLPDRPGLVPDRLPDVRRPGHGRPRQGLAVLRGQRRRPGRPPRRRRLRAAVGRDRARRSRPRSTRSRRA